MSPDTDGNIAAFCRRFPNSVTRDTRLSDVGLVLLAYRSTFAGPYALNQKAARAIVRNGLGRDAFKRGVAEAKRAGYLERRQRQRPDEGTFGFAVEKLTLPDDGLDGRGVFRSWFDGSFSLKELAAILFLRAGGSLFARELADRFDWSRPTAAKVIRALIGLDVLVPSTTRRANGTFAGTTYKVPDLSKDLSTVKKPGHGLPVNGFSDHTLRVEALHTGKETDREATSIEVSVNGVGTTSSECGSSALERLIRTDHARTLSGYLRKDQRGLEAFLAKHGGEEALGVMATVLWRHAIDGKPVGSVKSWRYFEGSIIEERNRESMRKMGLRPGDLIASYRHFMQEQFD